MLTTFIGRSPIGVSPGGGGAGDVPRRPSYREYILSLDPTAYYPLNDTDATLRDYGAAAKNGTFVGTVTKNMRASSDKGRSRGIHTLNGGSSYGRIATITSGSALDIRANQWTATAMVRFTQFNADINVLGRTTGGTAQIGVYTGGSGAGRPYISVFGGGNVIATTGITDTHRWHHVVWVSSGTLANATQVQLYLDGVLLTNGTYTTMTAAGGGGDFRIGETFSGTGALVSEVAIFPTAFTAAQAKALYAAAQIDEGRRYKIQWGVHQDLGYDGNWATLVTNAAADGAKVSRTTVEWNEIEPTSGAAKDWSALDARLTAVAAAGMEPLLVLGTSPTWANGGADVNAVPTAGAAFTTFVGRYTTFLTAIVNRYKAASGGRPRVAKWEIWNEPNLAGFWNPTPNATQYVEMANAARTAILAEDPTAEIGVGVLGSVGAAAGPNISGKVFLQSAITAGLSSSFNIYSLHPYGPAQSPLLHTDFDNNLDDIRAVLDVLELNGRLSSDVKLWLSEFGGWDTGSVSQANQAAYLQTAMTTIRQVYGKWVQLACYFSDVDDSGGKGGAGLRGLTPTYTPKTARAVFLAEASA